VESGPAHPAEPAPLFDAHFWRAPLMVFVCLLALYLATLAPSVTGGDSGELVTAALTAGVPHPPGYPIFAMLARLFAALPIGPSPAWRVNLLSAVSTAAAAGLLCASLKLWTRSTVAALAAAVLFGTNAVVWHHATAVEIFGLHACFVALAFLLWLCVERTASRRFVFALSFASGLGMCNQHTFVFAGLPLVLRSLWVARHNLGVRGIGIALALGVLGLAPYAYLPLASASAAAVSWGDQTTLPGLAAHIFRRSYGTFGLGQALESGAFVDKGTFLPTLWALLGHAFPRFAWIGPPLAFAGFYLTARAQEEPNEILILGIALGSYVIVFCALSNMAPNTELYLTEVSRFFIQPDLLLAIAAGLGCAEILRWLRARWPLFGQRPRVAYGVPVVLLVLGVAANASSASRRNNHVFSDFAQAALASLPPNAIVITVGDHVSGAISYFHEVEKLRPDVVHLDREMLAFPWYGQRKQRLASNLYLPRGGYGRRGYNIKKVLDGNPTRPLTVIDKLDAWDESWTDGYKLVTYGLVHLLVPAGQFPTFAEWSARDEKAMGGYDVVPALRRPKGTWENALGQLVLTTQGMRAHVALVYSLEHGQDPIAARRSMTLLEDIIAKAGGDPKLGIPGVPGLPEMIIGPIAWRDLGVCYEILSRFDAAYLPRVTLAVERFVEHAPPDNPDLPAARKFLETHRPPPVPAP
jgi:hypothetical protein